MVLTPYVVNVAPDLPAQTTHQTDLVESYTVHKHMTADSVALDLDCVDVQTDLELHCLHW